MKFLVLIISLLTLLLPNILFSQDKDAQFLVEKGISFYKVRNIDSALYYYNFAIKSDSNCAEAFFRRALAKEKTQDIEGAVADYNKAIRIKPMPVYYNNLGMILNLQNDFEGAILEYDKAIELDSTYAQALFNKGIAYHHMDMQPEACKFVSKAREQGFQLADQYFQQFCQ